MFRRGVSLGLPVFVLAVAGVCQAGNIAFEGFETGTGDWSFSNSGQTGDANGSITQNPSGTGPLQLNAYDGSYYATIHGNTNGYSTGYANGGSSFFGFDTSVPPYPGSAFTQSMAVYVRTDTPAPTDAGTPAFWIDDSPSSSSPTDAGYGGVGYGGEHNFRLSYTGSSVAVTADGSTPLATITQSGWYVFQMVYAKGATDADLSTDTLSVLDSMGNLVGVSALELNDSDGDPLESQYLQGPGYIWLTVWQNGFSDDQLGIDDVRSDTYPPSSGLPEPGTLTMLAAGFVGVGLFGLARRRGRKA